MGMIICDHLRKLLAIAEKRAEVVEFKAARLKVRSRKQDQRITELLGELHILKVDRARRVNCALPST